MIEQCHAALMSHSLRRFDFASGVSRLPQTSHKSGLPGTADRVDRGGSSSRDAEIRGDHLCLPWQSNDIANDSQLGAYHDTKVMQIRIIINFIGTGTFETVPGSGVS